MTTRPPVPARTGEDSFSHRLIAWQRQHGRHNLPWQASREPYRAWLAEIMLQQTQVETVIPYYRRFLERFPDVRALAEAPLDDVLALWAGLGYYARARNLHRAAQTVMAQHGGAFPGSAAGLVTLPGIGRSSAASIAAFCFGERGAILDGNVKRVLARHRGIEGHPSEKKVENRLWEVADSLLPDLGIDVYTQGMMDLGAMVCTRSKPRCGDCPVAADCVARREGRTAELPTPRPRKATPLRSVRVLVLRCAGAILLLQRPASGIWGGLYSLPELDETESIAQGLLRLGVDPATATTALPALRHVFTHFTLDIEPLLCELSRVPESAREAGARWADAAERAGLGLPAPIKRLLASLD